MNRKKAITSIVLSLILVFAFSTNAFATMSFDYDLIKLERGENTTINLNNAGNTVFWTCPDSGIIDECEEVSKDYSAMDVFCSLSYREGFGLVVIEAAAMQLPGIVTDVPGQIDTHENMVTGITVHAKEVVCVVDAMKFYINNPDKLKEMGIEARKQVEQKDEQKELLRRLAAHRNEIINKQLH